MINKLLLSGQMSLFVTGVQLAAGARVSLFAMGLLKL